MPFVNTYLRYFLLFLRYVLSYLTVFVLYGILFVSNIREVLKMISYEPLRIQLTRKKMGVSDLNKILPTSVTSKFNKDGNVTMETIDKVCQFLHCDIQDVVEILPDTPASGI